MRRLCSLAVLVLALSCRRGVETRAKPATCTTLCGEVRDASSGQPIRDFTVQVFMRDDRFPKAQVRLPPGYPQVPGAPAGSFQVHDDGGAFYLPKLTAQRVVILVSAPHHAFFQSAALRVPVESSLKIALVPSPQLRGRVTDERGRSIPGARVVDDSPRRSLADPLEQREAAIATSDARGEFTIEAANAESRQVVVMQDGFVPRRVALTPGANEIRLETGGTLAGIVVDSHGAPVMGAWIEVKPGSGEAIRIATRADGSFTTSLLPLGEVVITASRELLNDARNRRMILGGDASSSAAHVPAESLRVVLAPSGRIRGRLRGLPRIDSNYRVTARQGERLFDLQAGPDGSFSQRLPAGEWNLSGAYEDELVHLVTESKTVTIADGDERSVDLPFLNPTEIRMRWNGVTSNESLAMTRRDEHDPIERINADSDGVYRIAGLAAGSYELSIERLGSTYRMPVEIGRGNVELDLRTSDADLFVQDSNGDPVAATVRNDVFEADPNSPAVSSAPRFASMETGHFRANSAISGNYTLSVSARGFRPRSATLRVPGEPLRLALEPLPFPFPHTDTAEPLDAEERAIIGAVVDHYVKDAADFWRRAREQRGRLVLLDQTARARLTTGFLYGESPETETQKLARFAASSAFRDLKSKATTPRSMNGMRSVLTRPLRQLPLMKRAEWPPAPASEMDFIASEQFYERYPKAAGLLMVSRAGISRDGREAIVHVSRLMVLSVEEKLIRLRRHGSGWQIEDSVVLVSVPGC